MMESVPLKKLVEQVNKWHPKRDAPEDVFAYISIGSIDNIAKKVTQVEEVEGKKAPSRARQLVKCNDILVSTVRPNLNGVAYIDNKLDGATASTGFCVLRPNQEVLDSRYLFHWVTTRFFVDKMINQATGASYPAVSDTIVKASTIPLPPLEEQRRITAVLDKAASLRQKRQQAIAKLDTLLQSIFLDMFGDPVTNPMGWEVVALNQIADIDSGVTKSSSRIKDKKTVTVPYMRVANVQDGEILTAPEDIKMIKVLPKDAIKYQLLPNDILLTEGGDPDKLGRGGIWRGEINQCIHQNHVFRVRITNEEYLPEYLSALIGSAYGKRYFLKAAKQTTGIASINKTQLRAFPAIYAPVHLQENFKQAVEKINLQKVRLGDNALKMENLFNSLQQRAFRGDL